MVETNGYEQVQTGKDLPISLENDIESQSLKVINPHTDESKHGDIDSNKPSSKVLSSVTATSTRSAKAQARLESRRLNHDIEWSQVSFKVGEKAILTDCYGKVPSGSVCAILGPSGAGKSSLLNVLAGRSASAPGYTVEGTVTVGGRVVHPVEFRQRIAYVMQDDALMPTATPREALEFSANLRLPSDTSKEEIRELVSKTITDLGLDGCADILIGGAMIKGISGGQRKRTSIGVEIITDPEILFLDEPTSGLDSFSAQSCINLFSVIAKTRHTAVLCTIHQPSSEVFILFDQVIFMKEGRIFYQGPSSELLNFFSRYGYHCPTNHNPADYVMLLSQTESMQQVEKSGIMAANQTRALAIRAETSSCSTDCDEEYSPDVIKATFLKQLACLTYRELTSVRRDTTALIARFGITIFLNLIYGLIFLNAGNGDNAVNATFQAHYGAISMVTISSMFGSSQSVLLAFPFERPLFLREYSTGTYTGIAYFVGKAILELPLTFMTTLIQFLLCYFMIDMQGDVGIIVGANFALGAASCSVAVFLGCIVNDVKDATELSTLLFVPQLLFSGFFINTKLIPVFLRWAQYLCSLKYALNLVLITEFSSSLSSCDGLASDNCETVLKNNNIETKLWWFYMLMLFLLFFVFRAIACVILVKKAKRFY